MTDVPGKPIWVELFSSDVDRAAAFYAELFDWTVEESGPEYGGYRLFLRDGEPVAGCMANDGSDGAPDTWTTYLESDDADATSAMAAAHGGQVLVPVMEVGEMGRMAVLSDPGGAVVGVWQPGSHRGFVVRGRPGAPAWFEVLTTAYPESLAFYANVFGWVVHPMSDTPEFRYSTLGVDDDALAGVMDATGYLASMRMGSTWQVYFEVADTDAAVARARAAGGELLVPVEDTPYGRLGRLADPTGAAFVVIGSRG